MSILLSAYYPEGIIFAADKNASIQYMTADGKERWYVAPTATKVLAWPFQRAVIGFVGLGTLAGYDMDEWMRVFIAETREFDNIDDLAIKLRDQLQSDFVQEYPPGTDISQCHVIVHLGGFALRDGCFTPVLYHIWNHNTINPQTGLYPEPDRDFRLQEEVEQGFKEWPKPEDYPHHVRARFENMSKEKRFLWFNNGANLTAFNIFKAAIWDALIAVEKAGYIPRLPGLDQRVAYCKMAVEVFGSFFTHHYLPEDRIVGGGVDSLDIPWPD